MNTRAAAFLVRSLRQESRLITHHLIRVILAAFVLILFAVRIITWTMSAGVGVTFASNVLVCCYWFVTLLGGGYFSTAIVEEKEEQTLPLLRMTGATPAAILLGKSLPRLAGVLLLLLVIAPFLFLAVTLGGVLTQGLLTASLGILTYAVMFSQIGLLASVISNNAQRAFSKTLVMWGLLEFLPFWCWLGMECVFYQGNFGSTASVQQYYETPDWSSGEWKQNILAWLYVNLQWLGGWAEQFSLQYNLPMYLGGFRAEGIWRTQMTAHLVIAAAAFMASWLLFELCTARVVAESHDSPGRTSRRTRRRVGDRALMWKSWQHTSGGWIWFCLRLIGAPLLVIGIAEAVSAGLQRKLDPSTVGMMLTICGIAMVVGHLTILFGRLFSEEIYKRTLSSLLLLPIGRNSLVGQSVAGLLPAIFASGSCVFVGLIILWNNEPTFRMEFGDVLREVWFYQVIAAWITTTYVGLLLSIRLRFGGMLLAVVAFWMMGPFVIACFLQVLERMVGGRAARDFFEYGLPWLLFQLEIPLCIWIHFRILRSLDRAGELS